MSLSPYVAVSPICFTKDSRCHEFGISPILVKYYYSQMLTYPHKERQKHIVWILQFLNELNGTGSDLDRIWASWDSSQDILPQPGAAPYPSGSQSKTWLHP